MPAGGRVPHAQRSSRAHVRASIVRLIDPFDDAVVLQGLNELGILEELGQQREGAAGGTHGHLCLHRQAGQLQRVDAINTIQDIHQLRQRQG